MLGKQHRRHIAVDRLQVRSVALGSCEAIVDDACDSTDSELGQRRCAVEMGHCELVYLSLRVLVNLQMN
jgi:hypothetical protein